MFTSEFMKACLQRWSLEKKTVSLCMNFGGLIRCADAPEKIQAKLKRIELRTRRGSGKLAEGDALPTETTSQEEDFVDVEYRALSQAHLGDRPVDFSKAKLKEAVHLLNGHTVYKDHDTVVDNWAGRVVGTKWDEGSKDFPPGINANLRLDAVKDPMLVRGVLQGALHSASVTVSFEWEPSHPKLMEDGDFFRKLGEIVDDEEVRILPTEIERFWEISMVWQGADTFAKQIGEDGRPVLENSISLTRRENHTHSLTRNSNNKPKEEVMLELLKKLFGKDVTEENLEATVTGALEARFKAGEGSVAAVADKKIAELSEQNASEKKRADELSAKVAKLEGDAKIGEKYLTDERAEAIRLCKLAKGEKVSETILKTLNEGALELVQAFKAEFQKEVDEKLPAKCGKCGSTEISRQSSAKEEVEGAEKDSSPVVTSQAAKTLRDLHA